MNEQLTAVLATLTVILPVVWWFYTQQHKDYKEVQDEHKKKIEGFETRLGNLESLFKVHCQANSDVIEQHAEKIEQHTNSLYKTRERLAEIKAQLENRMHTTESKVEGLIKKK